MKILLAGPRGFCAGVNMAIECLDLSIKSLGAPVYVYHEIVHNKCVVQRFKSQGAIFVDDLAEVPEGSNLLFSAHGISPEIRNQAKARKLFAIDATCPLVTKVHLEAVRYAREGRTIVLIGHEGHDEVIGTMGEAPEAIVLVETPEDVDRLEFKDPEPTGIPDPNDPQRRRCEPRDRPSQRAVPRDCRAAQGRHLLRDSKSARGGVPRAGRRGRHCARPR